MTSDSGSRPQGEDPKGLSAKHGITAAQAASPNPSIPASDLIEEVTQADREMGFKLWATHPRAVPGGMTRAEYYALEIAKYRLSTTTLVLERAAKVADRGPNDNQLIATAIRSLGETTRHE